MRFVFLWLLMHARTTRKHARIHYAGPYVLTPSSVYVVTLTDCLNYIQVNYGIEYYRQFTISNAALDLRTTITLVQQETTSYVCIQ